MGTLLGFPEKYVYSEETEWIDVCVCVYIYKGMKILMMNILQLFSLKINLSMMFFISLRNFTNRVFPNFCV